jgi:hypothetical protein|tara:strand:+ start:818 stop:1093 length:276 start_codon:yes stop_codon:yes gene_type:complete
MEKKTRKNIKNNRKTKKISKIKLVKKYHMEFERLKKEYIKSQKNKKDTLKLEELSTQILLKMDLIEIDGNQELRTYRKSVIKYINSYIDNL